MHNEEDLLQAIHGAVDDVNDLLPDEAKLTKSMNERLVGESAKLDSLRLVQLISALEQRVEQNVGAIITLADERAMSQAQSPFRTIGTLMDYTRSLLEEE